MDDITTTIKHGIAVFRKNCFIEKLAIFLTINNLTKNAIIVIAMATIITECAGNPSSRTIHENGKLRSKCILANAPWIVCRRQTEKDSKKEKKKKPSKHLTVSPQFSVFLSILQAKIPNLLHLLANVIPYRRARRSVQMRDATKKCRRRVPFVRNFGILIWNEANAPFYALASTLLRSERIDQDRSRAARRTYTPPPRRTQTNRGR